MNFASRSVKPDLKPQNEDYLFETETPRGQFFALLDFADHDFANLNSTLDAKLETIVNSFVTLSNFSPNLFLGFLAKEINNFLRHLAQQAEDSQLICSAALCLVTGDQLWYCLCGDTRVVLFNEERTFELRDEIEFTGQRLGQLEEGAALSEKVRQITLEQDDLILIMTSGLAEFQSQDLVEHIASIESFDADQICESLMEVTENIQEDRTLVVVGGPYERIIEPPAELSIPLVDSNERFDDMNEVEFSIAPENEDQRLREIDERLEHMDAVLANKADTAEVLGLQSEVLKLGVLAQGNRNEDSHEEAEISLGSAIPPAAGNSSWSRTIMWGALILVLGTIGGYFGGWAHASRTRKPVETWSVKSSGSQVLLSRLNETGLASSVLIPTTEPVKATGEQTFSSFADAKQYIDTVTPSKPLVPIEEVVAETETPASQPKPASRPITAEKRAQPAPSSVAFRQGDSLQKIAQRYNVATSKLIALNPTIKKWSQVKAGQKIVVPAGSSSQSVTTAQRLKTETKKTAGKEATVGAGETLDRLASRLKVTPSRLKQLNPKITNWSRIQAGQKVVVSNSARG